MSRGHALGNVAMPMIVVAACFFGGLAYLGILLGRAACKHIVPFEDGPRRGEPPIAALVVVSALLGVGVSARGVSWAEVAVFALVVLVLVAGWASDVLCGVLPDAFTLLPLAVLIVVRVCLRQWDFLFAGALVFLPFALIAVCSKGIGLGWGDVKLATLGGVLLGVYAAMWSFIVVSLLAVVLAWARGRKREPIAFGPYLAGAIGAASAATGMGL